MSNSDPGIVQDAHILTTADFGARTIDFRGLQVTYDLFVGRTVHFRELPDAEHLELRAVAEAALDTIRRRRQNWAIHTALENKHEYAFRVYLSNKWRL